MMDGWIRMSFRICPIVHTHCGWTSEKEVHLGHGREAYLGSSRCLNFTFPDISGYFIG